MSATTNPIARAVEILRESAAELKLSHTVGGSDDWTGEDEAKAAHDEYLAVAQAIRSAHVPTDPMDWPLPCDVHVGHGTMRKGVALRTLVTRMKVLYEMATGNDADVVANRTPEERQALAAKFLAAVNPHGAEAWCCEKGEAAGKQICDECAEISRAYSAAMGVGPELDDTPLETGEGDAR
jgi:hypothetical protein